MCVQCVIRKHTYNIRIELIQIIMDISELKALVEDHNTSDAPDIRYRDFGEWLENHEWELIEGDYAVLDGERQTEIYCYLMAKKDGYIVDIQWHPHELKFYLTNYLQDENV